MITNILLAVDGSTHAQRATSLAAELASKLNADLHIVHVLMHGRPPTELVRMAEVEHLVEQAQAVAAPATPYRPEDHLVLLKDTSDQIRTAKIISALGDQIVARAKAHCLELGASKVETSVLEGDFADAILAAAQEQRADMIVIGSRGLGTLKGTVLGSVSQKVLHHADCAVVTVR